MKTIHRILAVAALSFVQPGHAATTDPEVIIYRFPGVRDDGSANFFGTATLFHCTNFSGAAETIRFVTRDNLGGLLNNTSMTIQHLGTVTLSTHGVASFVNFTVNTGAVGQGTTAVAATSINIICTAMIIDAANSKPVGVSLRGIRFNPIPGAQE